MDRPSPRLTSVMGVARALLGALTPPEAAEVLEAEFGWDASFRALSLLRGPEAAAAFGASWERLLTHRLALELRDLEAGVASGNDDRRHPRS